MTDPSPATMPTDRPPCQCGKTTSATDAVFCPHCGRALGPQRCAACGVTLEPEAAFCHRCGTPAAAGRASPAASATTAGAPPGPAGAGDRTPWLIATGVTVSLLALIILKVYQSQPQPAGSPAMSNPGTPSGAAPFASTAGGGPAPDISKMTPKERFARLFNRVMEAGSRGDTATVVNFSPMALGAYSQLPAPDAGDRFDAALLHLQVGALPAAKALADTIRRAGSTNLLGQVLDATLARAEGRTADEQKALATFRSNFAAERKRARPEYADRGTLLEEFKRSADSAGTRP